MQACFSGPEALEAARHRTALTRLQASMDRTEARRRVAATKIVNGMIKTDDTLAAALHRTGTEAHQAFITRREMRRRSEVPIGQAGTSFDPAIARELEAWANLSVYKEVPYTGQVVISTRWVLTLKQPDTPTGTPRRKARLVVRGFQDPDRATVDSTSPRRRVPHCAWSSRHWQRTASSLARSTCARPSCKACHSTGPRPFLYNRHLRHKYRPASSGNCTSARTA